ncbi:MAG: hypothetical protein HY727_19280 [Candidatus Rokubacteria bacterium]|nr:hypothetical protein [Candidatus Rokubacteria bacterium]
MRAGRRGLTLGAALLLLPTLLAVALEMSKAPATTLPERPGGEISAVAFNALAFHPKGQPFLVSASDVAWRPDGGALAIASGVLVRMFDVK